MLYAVRPDGKLQQIVAVGQSLAEELPVGIGSNQQLQRVEVPTAHPCAKMSMGWISLR